VGPPRPVRAGTARSPGSASVPPGGISLTTPWLHCMVWIMSRQVGWTRAGIELLEKLDRTQGGALAHAAAICADASGGDGLVHLFGTGHSRMSVEEMFPRYGSYPGFHPMVELSPTFHPQVVGTNGQRQAMFIERVEGLAEVILRNFHLSPPDAMVVF